MMADNSPNHQPNFVVIGPGKSGTSWLYHVLEAHPHACMSSAKETLYFEDYYGFGREWYQRFFKKCKCPAMPHAIGEISNTYIFSPQAANRIAHDFPEMKIIATLRDPTERAFSHYLFLRRNAELNCDFASALAVRPDIRTRGNYFAHLEAYRQLFPAEQLGVFLFDDLTADACEYAKELFGFIGIGDLVDERILRERVLEASEPRNRIVAKCVVGTAHFVRRLGFPDIVTRIKNGILPRLVFRPLTRNKRPTISREVEQELRHYYRADVSRLSDWLGRDLVSRWCNNGEAVTPAPVHAQENLAATPSSDGGP